MSDPLRTEPPGAAGSAPGADRNARIEQLLLDGLDHYFAGRYEQAINVWTRAFFFDRSHPRARAYIERARAALAERQRESEELLESGVAAFNRGEGAAARRLLEDAISRGAPADEAFSVLGRLDRIDAHGDPSPALSPALIAPRRRRPIVGGRPAGRSRAWLAAWMVGAAVLVSGLWWFVASAGVPWTPSFAQEPAPALPPASRDLEQPQLPTRGAQALTRARRLAESGRLRDALVVLDEVRTTDPQRADADRLRATLQRELIALGPPEAVRAILEGQGVSRP
jgi:tetratricopeptide (TPR) repeat protein